jgi:short-subunit dehydrogenase
MLSGKVVVVTGAGAGIGRALVQELAARDADVWALDIARESLDSLVLEMKKTGAAVRPVRCDVTAPRALDEAASQVAAVHKRIDYWVNNAGVAGLGGFLETSAEDFERVLDINLRAVVRGTRAALKIMEEAGGGKIVNMASVAGHLPAPYMSAYNASKFGVVGFSRALQEELRLKGSPVKMLLVSPGFVDTGIIARGAELGFPEWMTFLLSTPEKVAKEIVRGMASEREEIFPTLNGRLIRRMHKVFPTLTVRSSKLLLTRSFKDALLNRYRV